MSDDRIEEIRKRLEEYMVPGRSSYDPDKVSSYLLLKLIDRLDLAIAYFHDIEHELQEGNNHE